MPTVDSIKSEIKATQDRIDGLKRLPVKSEVDWALIDDLNEYIASLYENLGELKREEEGRERGW